MEAQASPLVRLAHQTEEAPELLSGTCASAHLPGASRQRASEKRATTTWAVHVMGQVHRSGELQGVVDLVALCGRRVADVAVLFVLGAICLSGSGESKYWNHLEPVI